MIDAVGVDAEHGCCGAAATASSAQGQLWQPGDAPSQALEWAVQSIAKAGTLSIIGVYPPDAMTFPIGMAMNKNITINMGNCHHRKYIPRLIEMVQARRIDPAKILTQVKPMTDVIAAFESFDRRQNGWISVELQPQRSDARGESGCWMRRWPKPSRQRPDQHAESTLTRGQAMAGIHIGISGWRYAPWRGDFYPKGLTRKRSCVSPRGR